MTVTFVKWECATHSGTYHVGECPLCATERAAREFKQQLDRHLDYLRAVLREDKPA